VRRNDRREKGKASPRREARELREDKNEGDEQSYAYAKIQKILICVRGKKKKRGANQRIAGGKMRESWSITRREVPEETFETEIRALPVVGPGWRVGLDSRSELDPDDLQCFSRRHVKKQAAKCTGRGELRLGERASREKKRIYFFAVGGGRSGVNV